MSVPFDFEPGFLEILVEWNAPSVFHTVQPHSSSSTSHPSEKRKRNYKEGPTGGVFGMVHEWKKERIMDHGHNNFAFPNYENKQVRYSF